MATIESNCKPEKNHPDIPRQIEILRDEAIALKDCFTRFSFQALTFAAIVFGLIAHFQRENLFVGLAGIPLIVVITTVTKIGIYKYLGSNRVYGYLLCVSRMERMIENFNENGGSEEEIIRLRQILQFDWEELIPDFPDGFLISPPIRLIAFYNSSS